MVFSAFLCKPQSHMVVFNRSRCIPIDNTMLVAGISNRPTVQVAKTIASEKIPDLDKSLFPGLVPPWWIQSDGLNNHTI